MSTAKEAVSVREAGSSAALASSTASAPAAGLENDSMLMGSGAEVFNVERKKLAFAAIQLFDLFDGEALLAVMMERR